MIIPANVCTNNFSLCIDTIVVGLIAFYLSYSGT